MTKLELYMISQRITEINDLIDLCSDNDQDVLENLENELDNILFTLEENIKKNKLKLVG